MMAGVVVLAVGIVACGGDDHAGEPPERAIETALLDRLEAKSLSVTWVTCVESPLQGSPEGVYRCNVNFGDPHIEGYCAVMRDGTLVTHVEDASLRCARERTPDGQPRG